jgi:hypothetical protein
MYMRFGFGEAPEKGALAISAPTFRRPVASSMLVRSSTWPTLTLHLAVRICGARAPQQDIGVYPEMIVRRELLINFVFYTSRTYNLRRTETSPNDQLLTSPASQSS